MGTDLDGLGRVVEDKAYLLGFFGLGGHTRSLLHQDLLRVFRYLLGFGEVGLHACGEVEHLDEGEAFLLASIGNGEISP